MVLNRRLSKETAAPPLCQLELNAAGVKMIDITHKKVREVMATSKSESTLLELLRLHDLKKSIMIYIGFWESVYNIQFSQQNSNKVKSYIKPQLFHAENEEACW